MSARDDILTALSRPRGAAPRPAPYMPAAIDDVVQRFSTMAQNSAAELRVVTGIEEVPAAIADILRSRNLPARVHVPPASTAARLADGTEVLNTPPGPDDAAIALVPFAIAETGTLAYPASNDAPASWHFRAGLEIAILHAADVYAHMEDVLAALASQGLPPTLNFVTGPSRTGDIEQTLELGAHGPKALSIVLIK